MYEYIPLAGWDSVVLEKKSGLGAGQYEGASVASQAWHV
jgi:hypothetical protein